MPCSEDKYLTCYNRGCGKKYDPELNEDESCQYHAGVPFFHDAYKGWTCCKKKCTDFTEFLNIPGCTRSKHSNVKPPEPEKQAVEETQIEEVVEVKPVPISLTRPPLNTPMVIMQPILAPSIKQQSTALSSNSQVLNDEMDETNVPVGTPCKNGGCKISYEGILTNSTTCYYHPGYPVFHEGLKYWSCCQKRTTDFTAFLNQEGCTAGTHLWFKKLENPEVIECRWDWHQTGNDVVISVYAKQYCPNKSEIKLNPVRVYACLVFPLQNDAAFTLDLETQGIINVESSQVTMFGTKVEIKLRKAEIGKWQKLEIPKEKSPAHNIRETETTVETITPQVDAVDLGDLI